jgi:hypothetical protein
VIEERWVVVAIEPRKEGGEVGSRDLPNEVAALSLARDLMRQGTAVIRIQGPNGEVVGKEQLVNWVAGNPG